MYFNFTEKELKEKGGFFTAKEISQQPKIWEECYKVINSKKEEIISFFHRVLKKDSRIILTGAGTSDYIGDTVCRYLSNLLKVRVEAIATTDIVASANEFIEKDKNTILVSYGRSGNSPESVGAFDILQNNTKDIAHLVITCNENGELKKRAELLENSLVLLMPKECNDKSFAMTSSFSAMLLSTILAFDIENIDKNKKYIDIVAKQGEVILNEGYDFFKEISKYDYKRLVYLGSGFLKELCQEMALKNLELTSGKVETVFESVLGFRHGPKSIINDETLIVILTSLNDYSIKYDYDLIKEIKGEVGAHKLVVVSYDNQKELENYCHNYISIKGEKIPEIYTVFNYMLFGQIFGFINSLKFGISPDNPRPDGTVNRVVKGVNIYNFNE